MHQAFDILNKFSGADGGLESPQSKSPAPQECSLKRYKQRIYNNLYIKICSVGLKIVVVVVVPVI